MRIAMLLHKTVVHDSRVRREAQALVAAGHEVVMLELAPVPPGEERLDGFRRRSVAPPEWVRRRLPSLLYRPLFLLWFVRGIVAERPDIVHAHDAAMLLPGLVGANLVGARVVYDSHEMATSVPYREFHWAKFVEGLERIGVPRAAAVITVSDGIADRLQARYRLRSRPVVLRNVSALAPPNGHGDLRRSLGLDAGAPLVLHQGAPADGRGCHTLVAAMEEVPGAHLVFMGDAEPGFARGLREEIARRDLGDRVHLVPGVPLAGLLSRTAEADVGVTLLEDTCENHRMALPNKLFEYLRAGVPVVGSDLPEISALVGRYGVGWTVNPADPASVAGGLRTALAHGGDEDLRRRLAAADADLTWERESRRLLALYAALEADGARDAG